MMRQADPFAPGAGAPTNPKHDAPPVGAPPPVRTEQALPTRADTYSHPPRVLLQTQNATPTRRSTAGSPDRPVRTEQAPPRLPPSHPIRVLLQAAAPCRSTDPGANAPLVLNLFLMLLIQQIHNPAGRRIPLHSRQQRLAHKLIIIIT